MSSMETNGETRSQVTLSAGVDQDAVPADVLSQVRTVVLNVGGVSEQVTRWRRTKAEKNLSRKTNTHRQQDDD